MNTFLHNPVKDRIQQQTHSVKNKERMTQEENSWAAAKAVLIITIILSTASLIKQDNIKNTYSDH